SLRMFSAGIVILVILSIGIVQVLYTIFFLFRPYSEMGSFDSRLFLMKTSSESPFFFTFFILKSIVVRVLAKSSKNQFMGRVVLFEINASKSEDFMGLNLFSE